MASSGMTFVKIIFTLFNLIFMVGSIAIIYLGVGILTEKITFNYEKFTQHEGLSNMAYVLTAFGAFILILSFLGCCGAIRQNSCMLGVFGSIMALIVLTQIVLCVFLFIYRLEVENQAYKNSKIISKKIVEGYNYTNPRDEFTKMVDNVHIYLRCCGVNGTNDWPYGKVPLSCCKNHTNIRPGILYCLNDKPEHSAWPDGCLNKISKVVSNNIWFLGSTAISFALIQVMAILLSCCIAYSTKKSYQTI